MPRNNLCNKITDTITSTPAKAAGLLLMLVSAPTLAVANACRATFNLDNSRNVITTNLVEQTGCNAVTATRVNNLNGFAVTSGSCTGVLAAHSIDANGNAGFLMKTEKTDARAKCEFRKVGIQKTSPTQQQVSFTVRQTNSGRNSHEL